VPHYNPNDIGLIAPYKKDHCLHAVGRLNAKIRELFNYDLDRPCVGDLVVGCKNHRKKYTAHNFLNGQRGVVVGVSHMGVDIQFEGDEASGPELFTPSELELNGLPKHVDYGYAVTIHKSQGGEFNHVIVAVPKNIQYTFGRPALYTAFTRAKQTLSIIGAMDILPIVLNNPGARRITILKSLAGLPLYNPPPIEQAELDGEPVSDAVF
jgi:ATP-dependent exoDNAse (exonuclease V) alpha subunit